MSIIKKFKLLNKKIKVIIYILALVTSYALIGFLLLPAILKPILIDNVSEKLTRKVQLQSLKINPFTLSVTLNKLIITGKNVTGKKISGKQSSEKQASAKQDEHFFSINQLFVNFNALALFNKTIAFDEISLNQPKLNIIQRSNGDFNFQDLITDTATDNEVDSDENKSDGLHNWTFSISKFRYIKGGIDFSDQNRITPFSHKINDLSIALDDFSTKMGVENIHELSAKTARGAQLEWRGNFSLFPMKSTGDITIKTDLMVLSDYLQDQMLVEIINGKLNIKSHYDFALKPKGSEFKLSNSHIGINDLEIQRNKDDKRVLSWKNVQLNIAMLDSLKHKILIDSISSNGLSLKVIDNKLTNLDFSDFFIIQNAHENIIESKQADTEATPWNIEISKINYTNTHFVMTDSSVLPITEHDIVINDFSVKNLKPFSNEEAKIKTDLIYNNQGIIALTGSVKPKSKQVVLDINIKHLNLKNFQAYLNASTHINIAKGNLASTLVINIDGENDVAEINIKGNIKLNDTSLIANTVNEEFLSWQALTFKGINFSYPKQKVTLDSINIKTPYLKFIMDENGVTNLQKLVKASPNKQKKDNHIKPKSTKQNLNSSKEFQAKINKITINNAKMNFSDYSLKPNFSAGIYNLSGDIKGLSTKVTSRAKVNLAGKVDKYAPVTIKGEINPLSHSKYSDIKMLFKGIELTTFTPYSGKFAGYKIDKGKLSLALDYKLSNNKLVAENQVILDQLTLGDAVDSENATSLPINFALSLLKDKDGVIDFNLPIRGDINNPDFHYSNLVWGALGDLIVGIVSSPFKALGNLVGDDNEDFDHIVFDANSSNLLETEIVKLSTLSKALNQRPELYIEVRGLSSDLIDRDEMAYSKILKKLNIAPKLLSAPLNDEEQKIIFSYYASLSDKSVVQNDAQSDTKKNKTEDNKTLKTAKEKDALLAGAIKFLVNNYDVNNADYLLLAQKRAKSIQTYLVETGHVPNTNIYILDSNIQASSDKTKNNDNQISVSLGLGAK